jgi:hypothetical protein
MLKETFIDSRLEKADAIFIEVGVINSDLMTGMPNQN